MNLVNLKKLLRKVEAASNGSPELEAEFAITFPSAPPNVTRSIDAVARLIETELPGWWWTFGYCTLSNDASLYVPSSKLRWVPTSGQDPKQSGFLKTPSGVNASMRASIGTCAAARSRWQC